MARVNFQGVVRGYSTGDDGRIWLSVDEAEPSEQAERFVHDMVKDFNPSSGHGFGSRDVPCGIKPGLASYRVTLTREEAKDIAHGSYVEMSLEVFYVRRVVFVAGRNGKSGRWASIPEMMHEVVSIKAVTSARSPRADSAPETAGAGSGSSSGGGKNK